MSDKRKPIATILLKRSGKKNGKIEVFKASDFKDSIYVGTGKCAEHCYRLRVNGKWFPEGQKRFFWKSEIRDMMFKGLKF